MKKISTLCIIHQDRKVLLGMKKRGFGAGRWNGFGGKLLPDESIEDAARREVREEAGIEVGEIREVGLIDFEFQGDPNILEVHIFRAEDFLGEPTESEEMKPEWFLLGDIPFGQMWPDDKYWFPLFLAKKKFKGKFLFGSGDLVLDYKLEELANI